MKKLVIIAVLSLFFASCISFNDNVVQKDLPKDLVTRNFYPYTSIMKYKLEELAGSILYQKEDGDFELGPRIVKNDYKVKKEIIDDGKLYHFFVDNTVSSDVKQNILGTANISENKKMELTISDVYLAYINYEDLDIDKLIDEFTKPLPEKYKRRIYIQGVLLSTVRKTIYMKQKGGVNVKVDGIGTAFDGAVYTSNGMESVDYLIDMQLRDFNNMVETLKTIDGDSIRNIIDTGIDSKNTILQQLDDSQIKKIESLRIPSL